MLVGVAAATFAFASVALAGFRSSVASTGMSVATKRIFVGSRTSSTWDVLDASGGGTGTNGSSPLAFAGDGLTATTNNFTSTWSTSRYVDFVLSNPLPDNVATSSVTFNFNYGASGGGTTCFYFDVRRSSTNAVLGTHGSTASPVGCTSSTTAIATSTPLAEVTNSDMANDLTIRVYGQNSSNRALLVDRASVSGSQYASFTLYPTKAVDLANGVTPTTTAWGPAAAGDNTVYTSKSNWPNAFNSSRWLRFTFPAYVPTGAAVTGATFNYTYQATTLTDTSCWYFEVYNGSTLLASHGSSSAPVSCSSVGGSTSDHVPLPEVTTAAIANSIVIKVYMKESGSRTTTTDLASVTVTYALD